MINIEFGRKSPKGGGEAYSGWSASNGEVVSVYHAVFLAAVGKLRVKLYRNVEQMKFKKEEIIDTRFGNMYWL